MSLASIFLLAIFVALMLLASLQALSASGHFPKASRLPKFSQGSGPIVLWTSIIVTAGSVAAGIAAAWMQIPWYAAVIGGSAAILLAPLALQFFPDRIVDGKTALIGFAAAAAVLAGVAGASLLLAQSDVSQIGPIKFLAPVSVLLMIPAVSGTAAAIAADNGARLPLPDPVRAKVARLFWLLMWTAIAAVACN